MIRIPISETSGWEEDATPCIATSGERRELNGAGSTAAAAGWGLAGARAEWTARRRRVALGWPAPGIGAGCGAGMARRPKLLVTLVPSATPDSASERQRFGVDSHLLQKCNAAML